jgi:hypothetical protein
MASEIFVNNVNTNLGASSLAADTTIKVVSTVGFPVLTASNYCRGVFTSASSPGSIYEYVIVTAVDTVNNQVTIVRGQEGAVAQNWNIGDIFFITDTAASLTGLVQQGTAGVVLSYNGRGGAVTSIQSDVTTALGFLPTQTVGTSLLSGDGTGGFANVTIGTGLTFVAGVLASVASNTLIAADVATATPLYPLFANVVAGAATTIYTADPHYNFTPATGTLSADTMNANSCFFTNPTAIPASYTVPAAHNAVTAGPISTGAFVVTVPAGSNWVVV